LFNIANTNNVISQEVWQRGEVNTMNWCFVTFN
jgi:hypothetical protein